MLDYSRFLNILGKFQNVLTLKMLYVSGFWLSILSLLPELTIRGVWVGVYA